MRRGSTLAYVTSRIFGAIVNRQYAVDFDDLTDATVDTLDVLLDVKSQYPTFKVTLFTIPRRTSAFTIKQAKSLGDWVALAPHGWRHTRGECFAWTDDEAHAKILAAKDMGIDAPIFRAPGWCLDGHVYEACRALNYVVASHETFRIPNTGVPEYVYNLHLGKKRGIRSIHGHLTPVAGNFIRDMFKDGRLSFPVKSDFIFAHEAGVVV